MSTNQQKNTNEEEVDLGSLFVIIGKGFKNFFNFIGSIFKGIFDFLINILLFLKSNIIKISGALILGIVIGFFLETSKPDAFGSEMILQPNFKSTRQLYTNVNFYNDLVKQKDTATLQKVFNIDKNAAASLEKFTIEPIVIDNDIINAYDQLVLEVDTLTIKSYEFESFKNSFTDYDYSFHKISVIAKQNNIFNQLGEVIISSVEDNKYFERFKKLTNENLNRKDSLYRENLNQLDSLRRVYMQVMLEEAKNEKAGTSIDLGSNNKRSTSELELFNTNRRLNEDLEEISEEKSRNYNVVNVISNFQPIGYEIKGVTENYAFLLGIALAGLMIVVLLLIKLNRYLENYKK
jgi:hypothetical protein